MIPAARTPRLPVTPNPGIPEKRERQKRQTKADLRRELLNARYAANTERMAALSRIEALTAERDAARADADRLAAAIEEECGWFHEGYQGDTLDAVERHEAEVAKR